MHTQSLIARFWAKVEKTDDCWMWTANATKKKGKRMYGLIGKGRRGEGALYAHRLSYELHKGSIPDGLVVMHTCDVTLCVNPDHLVTGTQSDNIQDMFAKGRNGLTGAKPGYGSKSLLTIDQLHNLRKDGTYMRNIDLASKYGIHRNTVRRILTGKTNQNR